MKGKVMTMMMMIMMADNDQGPSGKDQATGKDDDEEEEREQREESPPQEDDAGFRRKYASTLQEKVRALRANNTLMLARALFQSCRTQKQGFVWKTVAMRQMFGKWQLQAKLAKMAAYIEKRFTTSATPTPAVPENIHLQRKGWCS